MSGKRARQLSAAAMATESLKRRFPKLGLYVLVFAFGSVLTAGSFLIYSWTVGSSGVFGHPPATNADVGKRTVARLIALSDAELEKVDILEMNIAVAREIPGLENLNYGHYRQVVDAWTDQFRRWLPTVERAFHQAPDKYKNDIHFFRLGMLAQFLEQQVGIAYVEEQKQTQLDARKSGKKAEVLYTDPGHLLVHGLIDTRRGTCGTMATLHVTLGRLLGWPVAMACVNSHYVCRYVDGKVYYNIEATDTGRGGFAEGSDQDYMEKEGVSPKAVACGSDLKKLSAREMLGIFVAARARHFADTDRAGLAARDYALAHTLAPDNRKIYVGLVGHLIETGERLFAPNEHGHPLSLAAYLAGKYPLRVGGINVPVPSRDRTDPLAEIEAINTMNRANMERLMQPQGPLGPPYAQPGPIQPMYPQGMQQPR